MLTTKRSLGSSRVPRQALHLAVITQHLVHRQLQFVYIKLRFKSKKRPNCFLHQCSIYAIQNFTLCKLFFVVQ